METFSLLIHSPTREFLFYPAANLLIPSSIGILKFPQIQLQRVLQAGWYHLSGMQPSFFVAFLISWHSVPDSPCTSS